MPPRAPASVVFPRFVFDIEPDEEEIRKDLMLFQGNIKDYRKPLQYSKQVIIADTNAAFIGETDPITGRKWDALSDRALRVPRYGILRRRETGARLHRAMINRNNYGVSSEGIWLHQERIPEYAGIHQQDDSVIGSQKITVSKEEIVAQAMVRIKGGARRFYSDAEILEESRRKVYEDKRNALIDANKGGKAPGTIPQRRFLGPSPAAVKRIEGTFDEWAKDAIIIYKRGTSLVRRAR